MGILDSKSRVIDAVITEEGRRQLARGKMKIESYSFTDGDAFYRSTDKSELGEKVTEDATKRFYFEAPGLLPQDRITFESDDTGAFALVPGILTSSLTNDNLGELSGDEFSSQIEGILSSTFKSFKNLTLIGSKDFLFESEDFLVNKPQNQLDLSKEVQGLLKPITFDQVPEPVSDIRFSNSINFQYLPPLIKTPKNIELNSEQRSNFSFGSWENLSSGESINFDYLKNGKIFIPNILGIKSSKKDFTSYLGFKSIESKKLYRDIDFNVTPQFSKIVTQVFEISGTSIKKLDIIDLGLFETDDKDVPKCRIFIAGKIVTRQKKNKFLSIFTLVYS